MSPHTGASGSGLFQEPIFTFNRKEEMETENLSTSASLFGLRSETELVGDKEPFATLASESGASGSRDTCPLYAHVSRDKKRPLTRSFEMIYHICIYF